MYFIFVCVTGEGASFKETNCLDFIKENDTSSLWIAAEETFESIKKDVVLLLHWQCLTTTISEVGHLTPIDM